MSDKKPNPKPSRPATPPPTRKPNVIPGGGRTGTDRGSKSSSSPDAISTTSSGGPRKPKK